MNDQYLNLLGLAFRARKIVTGEENLISHIKKHQVKLVLIANDASDNTQKKLTDKCTFYDVPYRIVDDRTRLSAAIGKQGRVAVGIVDEGFAQKLGELLSENTRG